MALPTRRLALLPGKYDRTSQGISRKSGHRVRLALPPNLTQAPLRPLLTRLSGQVCAGKKPIRRRYPWPTYRPNKPSTRFNWSSRCRSTPNPWRGLRPLSKGRGSTWESGARETAFPSGARPASFRRFGFVLEVVAPGLLVIKHRESVESGKFVNVAVIEGDQIKILNHHAITLPDSPPVMKSILGIDSSAAGIDPLNVLQHVAVSMRQHGRGGSLLVVPSGGQSWRQSIVQPSPYSVSPTYSELADFVRRDLRQRHRASPQESIRRAIEMVAGLTAVDGATILTDQFELLAFGVKIARRDGELRVEQVVESEPIEGAVMRSVHPTQLGGTRHLSAAQFAQDQRDAVALVASQDGRFTVFAWSISREMVHAYRVEALLL